MNIEIPRLEGGMKSPAGISKHQGEARGYGSHGFQDFSGTDTYSRRKNWGWLGWTFTDVSGGLQHPTTLGGSPEGETGMESVSVLVHKLPRGEAGGAQTS